MYTVKNFKTKKALKDAIAAGDKVSVFQPNSDLFGGSSNPKPGGTVTLEGPHYPQPHAWYAQAVLDQDCHIIKVK